MDWEVVREYTNVQHIETWRDAFLGIWSLALIGKLCLSAQLAADLFFELLFIDGEWQWYLSIFNQNIMEYNSSPSNSTGSSGSSWKIKAISSREFLIGLALWIGVADCSDKSINLWEMKANMKLKRHWVSISLRAKFNRYMKLYCFKQFCQFIPTVWQDIKRERETVTLGGDFDVQLKSLIKSERSCSYLQRWLFLTRVWVYTYLKQPKLVISTIFLL